MADGYISQIKTPDNKVYLLKDSEKTDEKVKQSSNTEDKEFPIILKNTNNTTNETNGVKYVGGVTVNPSDKTVTATEFIGNIKANRVKPTIVKEWTNTSFYGSSASDVHDNSTFWMLSVKPDSWYEPWVVRFKITTTCPAAANYYSVTYCMYSGRADGIVVFNWNERYDHAHYYTNIRTLKKAGFDAGLGHAIGINLYASNNYTNANYYRSFKLEYYDCDNCTVTILDTPVKWANWPNGTTTNYNGNNNANAVDRGLQESGDANSYDLLQMSNTYLKNGSFRFPGISLFGYDREGYAQPFSLYQSDYTSYTASISNKATRLYNTNGIDWTRGIHYNSNGGSWAGNADMNISIRLAQSAIDLRYTDNCVSTASTTLSMVPRKPVYIRGTLDDNGLFHVAPLDVTYSGATYCRTWTQDIPTEVDNYVYWFIGYPYATSAYQINLYIENPLYWFHNGRFEEYKPASTVAWTDITNKPSTATSWPNWSQIQQSGANNIDEGSSDVTANTEILTSYASNNGFTDSNAVGKVYRRDASKVVNATLVKAALGTNATHNNTFLRKDGTWQTALTAYRTYTAVSGKKPTGNQTPGFGSTFDIEQVGQDATGQVSVTERTVKIPDTAASASTAGLVTTEAQTLGGGKTLRFTNRIYPLIGASAERSQWYKITFPYYNTTTPSSARWFMNSFDLHFGGGYNSIPSGVAHVTFYWTRAANNGAWTVGQEAALIEGTLANKIRLYYRIDEPGILYVNNIASVYNGIWIDNLYVDDSAAFLDWSTITIDTIEAITESTSPKLSDYTKITTSYLYNDGGTLKTDSNFEGKYIKGTWLYTSAATAKTTTAKLATIESDNFIYYITPANALKSAIGTTAIGAEKTPIYWNGSSFAAGTALKNLAYKDSLTASDIPDISGTYVKKVTSTDNAIARFNGETGAIQDSAVTIDDNGHITFGAEKHINLRMNRKTNDGGGWANNFFNWYDKADNIFAVIGLYGTNDVFDHMYIGSNTSYSSDVNLQIYANGTIKGKLFSGSGASLTNLPAGQLTGTISMDRIAAGAITNGKLANSKVTIAGNDVSLGGSLAVSTLVTSLGLSKAMRFIGVATVAITDGSTTDPVISGYSTKTAGDVIIDKDSSREYVWSTTGKWELLGGDESYWVSSTDTAAKFWRGDNTWSDTISGGTLKITNNSNTVTIGSQNTSFTHIYNSASVPFIFNNTILTTSGNLGSATYPFNNLYIGAKGSRSIYYVGTKATNAMITFLDNTSDTYGNGIKIGGGGTVVVGAGESAANLSVEAGTETLYLTSDGAINIEAGGDTITNRIGIQVTAAGNVIPVKREGASNNAQNLGTSDDRWATVYSTKFNGVLTPSSWIDGQRYQNGALNITDYSNTGSYNPWIRATNTWASGAEDAKVGRWFSFGTLGTSFYWMGSVSTRTENSYDNALRYDTSNGYLYAAAFKGKADSAGSADTAGKWTTARTLTIGNTGKSVDGSGNVSWSLAEIGAATSEHTHNYAGSSSVGGAATTVATTEDVTNELILTGVTSNSTTTLKRDTYLTAKAGQVTIGKGLAIDNTAFCNRLIIYSNQSNEHGSKAFTAATSSWGIGFQRKWNNSTEGGVSAGIYAFGVSGWRAGLAFRVKTGTTPTNAHDTTALILHDDGSATFANTVNATNFVGGAKWLMNRGATTGTNAVTISDSAWNPNQVPSGHTAREVVWKQRWTEAGITYTSSSGEVTNSDSADLRLWLSSSNTSNTLQVNMDIDGQIYALGGFKGNLIGNATTATTAGTANAVAWSNVSGKPIDFITHAGALNTNGWKTMGARTSGAKIAIAYNNNPASWNSQTYSSSLVFGCNDTKGLLDLGYNLPIVTFGGSANSNGNDNDPNWYFKLSGTSGQTYTFPSTSKTLAASDGSNASGSWGISITGSAGSVDWANTGHPSTFPPTIGTTSSTAMAGDTVVTNVAISANVTTNANYPIVFATSNTTTTAAKNEGLQKSGAKLYFNPSTGNVQATTFNGYTLAAASAKAVTDSSSASAISTGTSLPTERDIYYGLPTINGVHNYNSSTNYYVPTAVGTVGQVLKSQGSGAPEWEEEYKIEIVRLA